MSERDRGLRDELERAQASAKALEAELSAPHAPGFVAQRDTLASAVAGARDELRVEEQALTSARAVEREAQRVVDGLDARGRAANQQNLDLIPLLLLGAVSCLATSALAESGVDKWQLGFASALGLGLLFGPRVLGRLRPGGGAATLDAPEAGAKASGLRTTGSVLSLFGTLSAAALNFAFWAQVASSRSFQPDALLAPSAAHLVTQVFLGAAALLALGALRRAGPEDTAGRRASRNLAISSVVLLGSVSVTVLPHLGAVLAHLFRTGEVHDWARGTFGVFAPWLPFGLALAARWRSPRPRPALLGASLASTLTMLAVTFALDRPEEWETMRRATTVITALQLGALGAVLGFEAGSTPWPRARLASIAVALAGSVACLFALLR